MCHIYLCECISRNSTVWGYSCHPWLWPAYIYVRSWFAFIMRECGNKGFMFIIKEVWDPSPLPPWKVSLGFDEVLMSYYLFIFSSHQHVQHMTSQIVLIFNDFNRVFDHFLIWNYLSLNHYNFGTRRDTKRR